MPAAQPSKSSVSNVIHAMIAAGLQPGAVRVNADGSFCVDVVGNQGEAPKVSSKPSDDGHDSAMTWDEAV